MTDPTTDPLEQSNAEAARFRRQLRTTEADRDALTARLDTLRRSEAERIAGQHLAAPASLWAAGAGLPDVCDQDGNVDADRVAEVARTATDQLGLAAPVQGPRKPRYNPGQGARPDDLTDDGWTQLLQRR